MIKKRPKTAPDLLVVTGRIKLARAMTVLVHSHPFHGHIASGWRARPDQSVGTMGVSWTCGGVQLVWCPEFVDSVTEMELAGVLLHEVHHVVLRHPFLFPEQASPPPDFDAFAALVAEEISVNEFVTLPLPGDPMRLEQFTTVCPTLAPFESTRERYRKLYDPDRARRDHDERERASKTLEQQLATLLESLGQGQAVDNHAGWESFKGGGAAAALAVAVATAEALERHGHSLSPDLRSLIRSLHAGAGHGSTPGGVLETLAGSAAARLPWQKILRRILPVEHGRQPTFYRPPRRFPEYVGVFPGSRRVPEKQRLLVAIDTSGSMSTGTLDEIAAEVKVIANAYDVAVVEFDAAIQRRYRLDGQRAADGRVLTSMQGRGGTSFRPVFDEETLAWAAEGRDLSGIIVFTDGFGPVPGQPPREPVYWVLMGDGVRRPAAWGKVIRGTASDENGRSPAMPF